MHEDDFSFALLTPGAQITNKIRFHKTLLSYPSRTGRSDEVLIEDGGHELACFLPNIALDFDLLRDFFSSLSVDERPLPVSDEIFFSSSLSLYFAL